jgi:hypothetical protein
LPCLAAASQGLSRLLSSVSSTAPADLAPHGSPSQEPLFWVLLSCPSYPGSTLRPSKSTLPSCTAPTRIRSRPALPTRLPLNMVVRRGACKTLFLIFTHCPFGRFVIPPLHHYWSYPRMHITSCGSDGSHGVTATGGKNKSVRTPRPDQRFSLWPSRRPTLFPFFFYSGFV